MPWFPLCGGIGAQQARISTRLVLPDALCGVRVACLVDSGASVSLVGRTFLSQLAVKGLLPPDSMERPLPLTGASGDRLKGVEIDLIVKVDGLPETRERFFVGKFNHALLGLTWFQQVGVHFRNFDHPYRGRSFAVYPSQPTIR